MKSKKILIALLTGVLLFSVLPSRSQDSGAEPFLGMWALDLDYENNKAGWLEVSQEDGYLDAKLLWRWASVYPVEFTMINDGNLLLVRQGKAIGHTQPVYWFEVKKKGDDMISGRAVFPNEDGIEYESVTFTGKRIPPARVPDLEKVNYEKPVKLLNGKNLKGWELLDPHAVNGWSVVDGVLVNDPVQTEGEKHIHYGNLRTTDTYEDFKLSLEVNVPGGSNSGVYLRGIYEIQVFDSYGKELDSHNMGGLYSRITPLEAAEKPAGEWQQMEMILCQRHLTVVLNGKTIIDNQPVKGVTGGAITADEFIPGPIYLQGDHGKVSYRNIVLTPIK